VRVIERKNYLDYCSRGVIRRRSERKITFLACHEQERVGRILAVASQEQENVWPTLSYDAHGVSLQMRDLMS